MAFPVFVIWDDELTDKQSNPMIDLIITTPSNLDFHAANLTQNPSHYPLHARVLGASWVTWIQESFGAGAWFIPMVRLANMVSLLMLTLWNF